MRLSREGARRAGLGGQRLRTWRSPPPPSHWLWGSRGKWKPEKSRGWRGESGKAERSWGRRRPEREKWVAKRERRRRRRRGRPRPERTAGRGILAEQAAGGMEPRRPGGSQRKGRARRSRYLCGRSERPRGSRVLQQFHLDLLRHHRRRCGRRLGHVALDHWRKVGREPAASSQAPPPHTPRRWVPSSFPLLPAPGAARGLEALRVWGAAGPG